MLILEDEYAGRIDAATAGFPGGRIKNETTPGVSNDGTPLDKAWANNIEGALQAILDAGNETPNGSIEQVGASQVLDAIQYMIANAGYLNNSVMVGAVQGFVRASAPAGWVEGNGGTIGSAASGASERANADVFDLYEQIWDGTDAADLAIFDSGGTPTTKGASAAADFAADKSLSVPDLRGEFLRGWDNGRGTDSGRALGSWQDHQFEDHTHTYSTYLDQNSTSGGSNGRPDSATTKTTNGANSGNRGSETRPRNIAVLVCIKY